MALAIEGIGDSMSAQSPSSPHTATCVTNGDNRILIVGVSWTGTASVGDVTYNGVSMTLIESQVQAAGGTQNKLFYLLAPDTGSNTISVPWTASMTQVHIGAVALSGAQQAAPNVDAGSTGSLVATASTTLTSTIVNTLLIDSVSSAQALTVGDGQTQIANNDGAFINGHMSIRRFTSIGSIAMTWTGTNVIYAGTACAVGQYDRNAIRQNNLRPRAFAPGLAR